jgi:hypothetical protein
LNAAGLTQTFTTFGRISLMRKAKLMLAAFAITVAMATPLLAAVSGSCSKRIIVDTGDEIVSCDLTDVYTDGHGNIVGCGYAC